VVVKITETLAWAANVGYVLGAYLIAKKDIRGWYSNLASNFLYMIVGIIQPIIAMVFLEIFLITINIYAIVSWGNKK